MSTLDSILQLLGKWPAWKRITEAPERLDAIDARVAALEDKLRRAPGEACPKCGEWALRVIQSRPMPHVGMLGARIHELRCERCGFTDERGATPT